MFGWPAAEAVGRNLASTIIPARLREAHQRGLEHFLKSGEGPILRRRIEVLALHRTSREFPIELSVTPLRLGKAWRFSAFIRDLTEAKAAERRLTAQHSVTRILAHSDSLLQAAPGILRAVGESLGWQLAVLWTLDRNAAELRPVDLWRDPLVEAPEFEAATRAGAFSQGIGLPGLVWQKKEPIWIPDMGHESTFPRSRSAAAGGLHGAFGFPVMAGPEVIGVIECFSREIRSPDPALLAMVASIGSQIGQVAERRRAEAELRANEASYRLLFESNPEAMWVFDAETLCFLAVNDAATRRYGYSRDEFLSMSVLDIRPAADRAQFLELWEGSPQGPLEFTDLRHCKKDGTILAVEVSADSISFAGRPARLVLVKDVTERKRFEEQLRQSQKMEAVGRLAGGVAHDFNNLLTAIQGYSDLILDDLDPEDRRRADVLGIREAAERAAGLTQQLLAFSRRQVLAPEVLDLNSLVRDAEQLLRRLISEDIEIHAALAPDLGPIRADPVQLQQVVLNLALNARDAMSRGGMLTLETQNVEVGPDHPATRGLVCPGGYVLLAVTDTGIGMDEKTKANIFEPFFTTKSTGEGTGLGLATVYGIVRQSGGFIWVYSELNHGSSFKVYLPRVESAVVPTVRPAAVQPSPRGSETILLVEDEELVRRLAQKIFEGHGYSVIVAGGGKAALELVGAGSPPPDLLVTDVVMPGMSGRVLAEHLRARQPQLKVLYLSGYTDDAVVRHGVLQKDVFFLQKPFNSSTLLQKVRGIFDTPSPSPGTVGHPARGGRHAGIASLNRSASPRSRSAEDHRTGRGPRPSCPALETGEPRVAFGAWPRALPHPG
jgi:two-component system cell cycle sensor histidine kinase/response regulator CckA